MDIPVFYNGEIVAYSQIEADDLPLVTGVTWRLHTNGYAIAKCRPKWGERSVFMHRVILPDCAEVDHINGLRLDNRRSNLRPANRQINTANRKRSRSGFIGVSQAHKSQSFAAQIQFQKKMLYLGCYCDAESAARAYDRKASELYGIDALLNFPH